MSVKNFVLRHLAMRIENGIQKSLSTMRRYFFKFVEPIYYKFQ